MQNWMQYHLVNVICKSWKNQTLVVMSGHPLGLFSSHPNAPRVVITNRLMVGLYDDLSNWNRALALVLLHRANDCRRLDVYRSSRYCPWHILHLVKCRKGKTGNPKDKDLAGHLFVSSGLGGMSGAQGKACRIAGE